MSPGLTMRSEKLRQFGEVFGPEDTITSSTSSMPGTEYRYCMMCAVSWFSVRPGWRNFMNSQCAAPPIAPTMRSASCSSSFLIARASIFGEEKIEWTDGMTPMMEARAIKNEDEQEALRMVGAIGDAAHWEFMKFLQPGRTENQLTAHIMQYLYSVPGMEDVEDVIVSSGPNTWPNWRNFSDRIVKPGDIVFMDLAALTWNGYKSCYYRTYCAGKEPSSEQKDIYATALKWLYDSIKAVKVGTTTREIASKWPSAKEAWGYAEEDQAAANLWGHGLGLAQYDQPVISRIWSLDHPIEIKEGMVFALETQHGKKFKWGVRIEEMLIVHKDKIEIISNFPVEQITVVDPMPGYSTLAGR